MPTKTRKHSLTRVRENYSYTVEQIAELFDLNVNTVRRWIREEGLQRIPRTRPYLIHSSDLKRFWEARQKTRKSPCADDQIYCCKCRAPRLPQAHSGNAISKPNASVLFKATCSVCTTKVSKAISTQKWGKGHPLEAYLYEATKQHNGVQCSPRECATHIGEQLCLNITP